LALPPSFVYLVQYLVGDLSGVRTGGGDTIILLLYQVEETDSEKERLRVSRQKKQKNPEAKSNNAAEALSQRLAPKFFSLLRFFLQWVSYCTVFAERRNATSRHNNRRGKQRQRHFLRWEGGKGMGKGKGSSCLSVQDN
jgi:hypothetical protein